MPKISVKMSVTWETYSSEVLEAIRVQTFQGFEACASSSLGDDQHRDLLNSFCVKFTSSGPNLLEKMLGAHQLS